MHFHGCGACLLRGNDRLNRPQLEEAAGPGQAAQCRDFVVMELMDGSLGKLLDAKARTKARTPWPWTERLSVMCDVAEGMAQMHAKRFIHRDLKPDNVLLDGEGRAKIADLGMARSNHRFNSDEIASLAQRREVEEEGHDVTWTAAAGTPPVERSPNTPEH